ncbi:pentatricopeptide repeat-containing protein At5g10690-like [Hevea brasiliensis]|uniref:pentatricopeptide repeat-containing protein At5g10690-like n=1 Tax=Hevea brasiliensis TaxID=3981 RepID=UPI0025F5A1E6|nr:pentatricopeptide repeat-containing protein At5g10690-like [Hevea brasiliensis]XP_057994242.1 pentatricopeptide repeat-containing protein At5g10690-like [Hevea brasiliensis]XP_057994267.1 pentatricopeptide repeat-containing protein At5g10690-like [Hevea brasiliensis]XP_057994689.1 pentatricopeptide repeat-containing protein At5g10690-like [Hevea brasiliensis]XP_057994701.1 pentatricopeptide repeat-containing protein At5g10690-like [Hevea brasiliensis]XP_057994824.1 pentatricopeptide repeat-
MNAVMEACVCCYDINSVLRIFCEMLKPESCGVDGITYGTLLKGLGDARRINEAFQILGPWNKVLFSPKTIEYVFCVTITIIGLTSICLACSVVV